jgi:hypothetical protein
VINLSKTVLAVFSTREDVEAVVNELEEKGYNPKEMSLMMKDSSEAQAIAEDTGADVVGDTVGGATTGAILGGLAGLLAATVIPGLGAFFIGGPIAAALGLGGAAATTASGAATGAIAGGILGALTSMFDIPEEDARLYETRINEGAILVAVPARDAEGGEVKTIMNAHGADNVKVVNNK